MVTSATESCGLEVFFVSLFLFFNSPQCIFLCVLLTICMCGGLPCPCFWSEEHLCLEMNKEPWNVGLMYSPTIYLKVFSQKDIRVVFVTCM